MYSGGAELSGPPRTRGGSGKSTRRQIRHLPEAPPTDDQDRL